MLFERYPLLLYGVSMKYLKNEDEARDAVQQVFLKAITELHKYEVKFIKSWLYMVAKNHCLMKLREKGRAVELHHEEKIADEPDPVSKQEHFEKDRRLELLTESVSE